MDIRDLQADIGRWAEEKGWGDPTALQPFDPSKVSKAELGLALIAWEMRRWSGMAEEIRLTGEIPAEMFGQLNFDVSAFISDFLGHKHNIVLTLSKLALVVTEVTEAVDAAWEDDLKLRFDVDGKPEGVASELADIVIRVINLAHLLGIDMRSAIVQKMAYNWRRSRKHGGKHA